MKPDLDQPLQTHLPLRTDLPEEQLRAFLEAVALGPERVESALVFADWLEEHGDARGQAVRWSAWKDSHGRGSVTRRALAGKLHAWIDHYRPALVGTEQPGGTLEWSRGLLRLRANTDVFPVVRRNAFVPAVWDLIEEGWIAEVGFLGAQADRLLSLVVSGLGSVPRIRLERCGPTALDALKDVPALRALHVEQGAIARTFFDSLRAHAHLEELSLEQCRLTTFHVFDMPSLRSLSVRGCSSLPVPQLSDLPELQELHIGGTVASSRFELHDLPALKRVCLGGLGAFPWASLRDLPALESLTLHNLSVRDLALLRLPALKRLDFWGTQLGTLTMTEVPSLRVLDLGKRQNLQTIALRGLPVLERLKVYRARWLRAVTLEQVAGLQELILNECARLTPGDVAGLLEATPALTKLDVQGIPRLGPVWIRKARKLLPGCEIVR
jgi:uncharacterized protein (TIGR02996 family)